MEVNVEGDAKPRVLSNHGLPEHPWCPPKPVKKIVVKPIQKYFWSKRSPEYLEKIASKPPHLGIVGNKTSSPFLASDVPFLALEYGHF